MPYRQLIPASEKDRAPTRVWVRWSDHEATDVCDEEMDWVQPKQDGFWIEYVRADIYLDVLDNQERS
ncbi:MAG: hypothetical protein AAF674_12960 [Pseudomonadota bacterium]